MENFSSMTQTTNPSSPLFDVSAYAHRSLARMPAGEHDRFLKAWRLLGSGGILALVREGDMALSGAGVCEALLARSWAARHHDPRKMLQLASAGLEVAEGLKARDLGRAGVAALQARAWGELANAFRVAGRPEAADRAFEEAFGRMEDDSDLYLMGHLLELRATRHGSAGDPVRARLLLSMVTHVYDALDERHLAGRARITQSIYAALAGREDEALRLSEEGLGRIDRARDPLLVTTALHNRLLLLSRLGLKEEAARTLALCGGLAEDGNVVALRLRWMEGRVLHELGELESAETALRQARDGMTALGLKLFTAVASMDLAATLLRQGRFPEAQSQALAALGLFLELERRAEYLGVLLVLDAAFRSGEATPELVERALVLLRRKELERA